MLRPALVSCGRLRSCQKRPENEQKIKIFFLLFNSEFSDRIANAQFI
jgi:hypothetical protein